MCALALIVLSTIGHHAAVQAYPDAEVTGVVVVNGFDAACPARSGDQVMDSECPAAAVRITGSTDTDAFPIDSMLTITAPNDLTIAADNARFGQVGPKVGSFDGGFGAGLLANTVGPKKAKEIWFLCRQYSAEEALQMGLVNTVVPLERLETETVQWCNEMLALSPFALRLMKASFNAAEDGLSGIQQLAHDANLLFYGSEEAQEGRDAYKQKRPPDFSRFPKRA